MGSIIVDKDISNAIAMYVSTNGISQDEFAKRLGISAASVSNWQKVGYSIKTKRWNVLYRFIADFLPKEKRVTLTGRDDTINVPANSDDNRSSVTVSCPLFTHEQIEQYNPMFDTINSMQMRLSSPNACYIQHDGMSFPVFAVELSREQSPYKVKTNMFVAELNRKTELKQYVIVGTIDGKVLVGIYRRKSDSFEIRDMEDKNIVLSGKLSEFNLIRWIFSVVQVELLPNAL